MLDIRWQILLVALAGWVNRRQLEVIAYLREENRVLKEHLGGRRLHFTDPQRRRLAATGHCLGRRTFADVATLVTPDTILRWHRRLIARKWTTLRRRVGRPGVRREIRSLTVRMARENPTWGYRWIQGALKNLGHRVARSTIATHPARRGIGPVPERPTSWRTFLAAHWGAIAAADFFTTEVWTVRGLVTYYTLFVIDLASRRVHIVGSTPHPDEAFVLQTRAGGDRRGRGLSTGRSLLDLRSRHEMERGRSPDTGGGRDSGGPDALRGTQLQYLRRTVRPINERRMLEPSRDSGRLMARSNFRIVREQIPPRQPYADGCRRFRRFSSLN